MYLDHSHKEKNQFLAHVASQMKSYVPFSRTQGYEAIHDDATTSNGKQGLPRFSDVTQIEAQSGARAAFGISTTALSALNEVMQSKNLWTSQAVPALHPQFWLCLQDYKRRVFVDTRVADIDNA